MVDFVVFIDNNIVYSCDRRLGGLMTRNYHRIIYILLAQRHWQRFDT